MRSVLGGRPAITLTHASHTAVLDGQRARLCPVKLVPIHLANDIPRTDAPPHTQHQNDVIAQHPWACGELAIA